MSELTLGLDLGPNSIGWALLDESKSTLVGTGVRVFPEGVDNFDTGKEVSQNENRRTARMMRRQTLRRARRKKMLKAALISAGLFPDCADEQAAQYAEDPYVLRARALQEKLPHYQIGRLLLHLNQRRGFKSLRKAEAADKETQGMLAEISDLQQTIEQSGSQTLGNYLSTLRQDPHARIRNRHTRRSMLETEFDTIWEAQALHYPELLTDSLRYGRCGKQAYPKKPQIKPSNSDWLNQYGIHGILFFQRNVYWPASMVGLCELEPKELRCAKSDRAAQRFRLLTEVNNLRIIDPDAKEERALSTEERTLLLDKLRGKKELKFERIREALGFEETIRFNLERGKRPKLLGMPIDALMVGKKAFGKSWHDRPESEKDEIVRALIKPDRDEDEIETIAVGKWGLTPELADALLSINFPAGYTHLSLKAINKLMPYMERGMIYMADDSPEKSALAAAGYLRRDQLQQRVFDRLPDPKRTRDCPIGDLPNPVVKRTLTELRKLVNAIIREFGKPDAIHVEMARSLKMGPQKRKEYNINMREREQRRNLAADRIREHDISVNREAITLYLLWEEQNHECVYSGKTISVAQLFSGEVNVDHVLPRKRIADDSQMNKVVCFRRANHDKGNRTPREWLAESDPDAYEAICERAKKLPYPKYRRFLLKELKADDFVARQLVDTAYIAKASAEYLRCLFDQDHKVLGLKGALTAELRWQWGLETLLSELPDSPAWQQQNKLRPGEKNRADHRHHAIDAIVVALTNRKRLQHLAKIRREGGTQTTGEALPEPWPDFRNTIKQALSGIKVSHRVRRKVSGKLHDDTLYGPTVTPGEFVVRKPVESLSSSEIDAIRDPTIREIIIQRLRENGIEFGRGKKVPPKQWVAAVANPENPLTMPSGIPIRKVRIIKKDQTICPIRKGTEGATHVKPGSTHHLCIFEWKENGKTKRDAVFVSRIEALKRVRAGEPIIIKTPPSEHSKIPSGAKFIMSLSQGEMVLADWKDEQKLLVYRTGVSTERKMTFAGHTDSRKSQEYEQHRCSINKFSGRKVTVDLIGRIRWAND